MHYLVKFHKVKLTIPKVINAHMWNFKPNFKCSPLKFWGIPTRFVVCVSKFWQMSAVCRNFRVQHTLGAEIWNFKWSSLECVNMSVHNFLFSWPKFNSFYSSINGWNVVDQVLFRFSICRTVQEIFAIKVESCQKSRRILDISLPSQIL